MYSGKRNKNNNNFWTIFAIEVAIIIGVDSILFDRINTPFVHLFKTTIHTWLFITILSVSIIFISLCLGWFISKRSRLNERDVEIKRIIKENLSGIAFQNYWEEEIYIPMEITDNSKSEEITDDSESGKITDNSESEKDREKHSLNKYLMSLLEKTVNLDGHRKMCFLNQLFMSRIKKNQNKSKYICLMGDTGSGKTDALVHFFIEYVKKHNYNPSMPQIKLYTMNIGYGELLNKIQEDFPRERDRKNCILLLDALDECKEARGYLVNTQNNNPSTFMEKLSKDTLDFATVVVSCRKQFFMREEFHPDKTGIKIGKPSGSDPFLHWKELHLTPFSDIQVKQYLRIARRSGKFINKHESKEARRIVFSCKELFLRPLILANIDIVLKAYRNRQEPLSMKDVYDAIVFYWIQREADSDKIQTNKLLNASLSIAAYMYKNGLSYLDEEHYKSFCEEYKIDDTDNLLRIKSLLNNDKNGFKFSHKSFYEYLLAYYFFFAPNTIGEVQGVDFALQIYWEIYDVYKNKRAISEMEQWLKTKEVLPEIVAIGLGTLANGLFNLNRLQSAESFYQESSDIYHQLAKQNSDVFLPKVATTLNNIAKLHYNTYRNDEAKTEYQEALSIYRQLAKKCPDVFLPEIATTLNNLAKLHYDDEAKVEYQEALGIHRQLAQKYPDVFLPEIATTLSNLAKLHYNTRHYDEAKVEYQEALDIRRQLAQKYPEVFLPEVATTLNDLAKINHTTNHYCEAKAEYQEALSIYRQLVQKNPTAFLPDMIKTLNNLTLYKDHHYDKVKTEYQEALDFYLSFTG